MKRVEIALTLLEDEERDLLIQLENIRAAKKALTPQTVFFKKTENLLKTLTKGQFSKERLTKILLSSIVLIKYIKQNGQLRTFEQVTLDSDLIEYESKGTGNKIKNQNTITVYDLVDKQFKTLIISEIISVLYKD